MTLDLFWVFFIWFLVPGDLRENPLTWTLAKRRYCIPGWSLNTVSTPSYCLLASISLPLLYPRWYLWKMQFNTVMASEPELSQSHLCLTQSRAFQGWSSGGCSSVAPTFNVQWSWRLEDTLSAFPCVQSWQSSSQFPSWSLWNIYFVL